MLITQSQVHTPFLTYDAAAAIAVANAKDDPDSFYNPVRYGARWAVEVLNEAAEFVFYLWANMTDVLTDSRRQNISLVRKRLG
jgi:hypothetical protein